MTVIMPYIQRTDGAAGCESMFRSFACRLAGQNGSAQKARIRLIALEHAWLEREAQAETNTPG